MYVYYFIYLYNATDIHMLYLFFCVMLSYGIEYIDALRVKVQWVSSKIIYIKFFNFGVFIFECQIIKSKKNCIKNT